MVPIAPPATIETASVAPALPEPKTRDALEMIRKSLRTRMWLLADLEAVREHEARDELEATLIRGTPLFMLPELATGARRLLLTARSGERSPHWALVAEHRLGAQALDRMFARLRERCDDHPIEGVDSSVRCGLRHPLVIAAPTSSLVVVLRPDNEGVVSLLIDSGGLPTPKAAVEAHVIAPRETFAGRQMPEVPQTIERGYGELRLLPEGGAALLLEGTCATPSQAHADADELNRIAEHLDLPIPNILKSALSRMLRFEAEGSKVRLQKELGYEQIRIFMLLVDAVTDRPRPLDSATRP